MAAGSEKQVLTMSQKHDDEMASGYCHSCPHTPHSVSNCRVPTPCKWCSRNFFKIFICPENVLQLFFLSMSFVVARCWRTCRKANCMWNSGNVVLSVSYYITPWEQVIVRLRFMSFISSKKHHHCPVDIQPANEGCSPTPWGAGRTLPTLNH